MALIMDNNWQWNLSLIYYNGIHISRSDSQNTVDEYKKGYFEFTEIHLRMVDKTNGNKLAEIQISFDENLFSIKRETDVGWSEFPLEKQTLNQCLATLNIPPIPDIFIENNARILDFDYDIHYPAADNIQSFKTGGRYHIGLNVNQSPTSIANKGLLEQSALSDVIAYL